MMVAVFVVNVSFNLHNIYGVFAVIDVHILLCTITNIKFKVMKLSKPTKSNSQHKVLRMIARNEQLERFDGKFVAMNRKYKDHSKYNRKEAKRELRRDLRGSYCIGMSVVCCNINPNYCGTLFFLQFGIN